MANSLPMNHFGRGAGKIPMPRAITREARKEWLIHPSFIILVLAIAITLSMKMTFSNKKLFKQTKTIIILPETPPVPEPTVKKKVPLIKVLKDAVKKSVEPKRIELKKIAPKKPKPVVKKQKKIIPKKPKPLKLKKQTIEPKKVKLNAIKPQKRIQPKKLDPKKITAKKINPAQLKPKTVAPKSIAPKKVSPSLAKPSAPVAPKAVTPQPKFTGMAAIGRSKVAKPLPSNTAAVPSFSTGPAVPKGAMPKLTQRVAPSRNTIRSAPPAAKVAPAPAVPVARKYVPPASGSKKTKTVSLVIQGSTMDNSGRVKNLKAAIRKKAMTMSETQSPYRYMVKGYQCTVVVKGTVKKQVTIEFSPADAPFDVVSALERKLPR